VDSMLIVESHISQQRNDKLEMAPAVENLCSLPDSLGVVDTLLADTGYFSQKNVQDCNGKSIVPYPKFTPIIAKNRKNQLFLTDGCL